MINEVILENDLELTRQERRLDVKRSYPGISDELTERWIAINELNTTNYRMIETNGPLSDWLKCDIYAKVLGDGTSGYEVRIGIYGVGIEFPEKVINQWLDEDCRRGEDMNTLRKLFEERITEKISENQKSRIKEC